MHSAHLRTLQQLKRMNTPQCLLPVWSKTYSFYPFSSKPVLTAQLLHYSLSIRSFERNNSLMGGHRNPSPACHTCILPGVPSEQDATKNTLQPAITHTAALSWFCCTNCLLFSWRMENYLSHFTKAKKTQNSTLIRRMWITSCGYI